MRTKTIIRNGFPLHLSNCCVITSILIKQSRSYIMILMRLSLILLAVVKFSSSLLEAYLFYLRAK